MKFKFLIEAGNIPDGYVVTKKTGTTKYTVKREIRIHGTSKRITANEGTVLLAGDRGNISSLPASTEVIVELDEDEAYRLIDDGSLFGGSHQ